MNRAGYSRKNLKSCALKRKNDLQQEPHPKESHYLKNRMRKGITLLPGFAHTGYQSRTVVKNATQGKNSEESLFSDSFQELIGHKNNLRRSKRLLTKHISKFNSSASDTNLSTGAPKKSKSIFENINRQYLKLVEGQYHGPSHNGDISESSGSSFDDDSSNENTEPDINSYRKLFGAKFLQAIRVDLKKNPIEKTKQRIKDEALRVNAILAGNVEQQNKTKTSLNVDTSLEEDTGDAGKIILVPSSRWIYRTPHNKKISTPQPEESNIRPAVLFRNGIERSLHELKSPTKKVKFSCKFNDCGESSVQSENFKSMCKAKRTPPRLTAVPLRNRRRYVNLRDDEVDSPTHVNKPSPYYDYCQPDEEVRQENNLPHFRGGKFDTCITEHDITIVLKEGNDFEIRPSQRPAGTKTFNDNLSDLTVNSTGTKMFDFESQTRVFQ